MDERDWIILQVLYREKNITKAANGCLFLNLRLRIDLQQMEREFRNVNCEQRKPRVQFTPQGEYLVKCAEEMLLTLQKIKENVLIMDDN